MFIRQGDIDVDSRADGSVHLKVGDSSIDFPDQETMNRAMDMLGMLVTWEDCVATPAKIEEEAPA
jgi:hypothetical protein